MVLYYENYGPYVELVKTGRQTINSSMINKSNWEFHFNSIVNIMKDTIETEEFRRMYITIIFEDNLDVDLYIPDYFFNLIMWILPISTDTEITSDYLFFEDNITKNSIKNYIDINFIDLNRKKLPNIKMNNIIDDCLHRMNIVDSFSLYLANTINLEDTIGLMNSNPRFNQLVHADMTGVSIEDVSSIGLRYAEEQVDIIKNSDHCLADTFKAKEAVNVEQFKEVNCNIGTKPDGRGGVYSEVVNKNYITGGSNDLVSFFIEESTGRLAQIIVEGNVGISGTFARLLGLNNIDTKLHHNPDYVCDTKHFEIVEITSPSMLGKFINRYYRLNPNGMEYLLTRKDTHLIGQTIYLRSPITCASNARGHGICYRCYGDLAHTNNDLNIGKIAAEELSSKLTQMMLSAKHLLKSAVEKIIWNGNFKKLFEMNYNAIQLISNLNLNGYKMIIDPELIDSEREDNDDEEYNFLNEYNENIPKFSVLTPLGQLVDISTQSEDKLYITYDLNEAIRKYAKKYEEDKLSVDFSHLKDIPLFLLQIKNNDLSAILDSIKEVLNKSSETKKYDRNMILKEIIERTGKGKIDITPVHIEVILSNQIRSTEDILEKPRWDYINEPYQLLTLHQALINNPSLSVTLEYKEIGRTLYNPLSYRKNKPSFLDLFFMENPNAYLASKPEEETVPKYSEGNPFSYNKKDEEKDYSKGSPFTYSKKKQDRD